VSIAYREPLFRSWCAVAGRGLYLEQIPRVGGNVRIEVGDNVTISGDLIIHGAHTFDEPLVVVGNRVFLGHRLTLQVAQRIVIEEGAAISPDCFIADHDGHPSDLRRRIMGHPTPADEVRPVRIGRQAWIGRGSSILKGVTVGEGAVVGVHSVVISDIPPFAVAIGNPARVVRRLATEEDSRQ
jgi:acetyltransferase-like isoleucine patch superfamily enzyme